MDVAKSTSLSNLYKTFLFSHLVVHDFKLSDRYARILALQNRI